MSDRLTVDRSLSRYKISRGSRTREKLVEMYLRNWRLLLYSLCLCHSRQQYCDRNKALYDGESLTTKALYHCKVLRQTFEK